MAVFGYGRVSTVEQTTDNQRLEIERAGYAVEYWYSDTVSGKAHGACRAHGTGLDQLLTSSSTQAHTRSR